MADSKSTSAKEKSSALKRIENILHIYFITYARTSNAYKIHVNKEYAHIDSTEYICMHIYQYTGH
jgi:hypothetical protein